MIRVVAAIALVFLLCSRPAWAATGDCGQPISNGDSPTATDALAALRAAVGSLVCELCVCDVDDSGVISATDALTILSVAVGNPLVLACAACEPNEPAFPDSSTVVGVETTVVTPESGGSVSIGGATLEIAPGIVSEAAEIGLLQFEISEAFADDPGARGGQRLLSRDAFVIVSNGDVELSGAIMLTLPIDPALVPTDAAVEDVNLSFTIGGYAISQEFAVVADFEGGSLQVEIPARTLLANFDSMAALGQPRAAGLSFTGIIRTVFDSVSNLFDNVASSIDWALPNGAVATIDDIKTAGSVFAQEASDHFRVRFRGSQMDFDDAREMTAALEAAYGLLVDELGFDRRTLNLPGDRYVVYFDDFANHVRLPSDADGFTLPGSLLFDGASYVNTTQPRSQWATTAVHEYFHTLQAGSLSHGLLTGTEAGAFERLIESQSDWLYEGTAAALGARVVLGAGVTPTRDPRYANTIVPAFSLYDPAGQPLADAAQDFFVFLETYAGNDVSIYKTIFDSVGGLPFFMPDAPGSVEAVDEALGSIQGLSIAWLDFVLELTTNQPSEYGSIPDVAVAAFEFEGLEPTAEPLLERGLTVPPLAYDVIELVIPPFSTEVSRFVQAGELEITVSVSGTTDFELIDVHAYNLRQSGEPPVTSALSDQGIATLELPGVRSATGDTSIRLVVANGYFEASDELVVDITAQLLVGGVDLSTIGVALVTVDVLGRVQSKNPDGTDLIGEFARFERSALLPGAVVENVIDMSCVESIETSTIVSSVVGTLNSTNTVISNLSLERDSDAEVIVDGQPEVVVTEDLDVVLTNLPLFFEFPSRVAYRATGFDACTRLATFTWSSPSAESFLLDFACNSASKVEVNFYFGDDPSICSQ